MTVDCLSFVKGNKKKVESFDEDKAFTFSFTFEYTYVYFFQLHDFSFRFFSRMIYSFLTIPHNRKKKQNKTESIIMDHSSVANVLSNGI